jgi:hypothetical protein
MKKLKYLIFVLSTINMIVFIGCEDINQDSNPDYTYLKGTWIDKESFAMQFIDFYSENQASFGMYGKNFEKYDSFYYRIIDSKQIAIDFHGDNESNETFHDLIKNGNDTIEISDLTEIPENPNKVYLRREIITEKQTDTIVIGHNQEYFDFDNHFRLRVDSVLTDSRCAIGANCKWEGNAKIRLDLILQGNYQHFLILNTNQDFSMDTLIDNINYRLVRLEPYPEINQTIDNKDYIVKVMIEKQ